MSILLSVLVSIEMEIYLKGVIPSEMPALWPMEALKAQTIAARTYAFYRFLHPITPMVSLWSDARSQVWNCHLEHPRSNQAIKQTSGLVIWSDGSLHFAEYIRKCGRDDCPFCNGSGGFRDEHWTTRMCQYGAQHMAEEGATYEMILSHYYGSVIELVPIDSFWVDPEAEEKDDD